jgi:IclR family KDG regulon transcriptional repressor
MSQSSIVTKSVKILDTICSNPVRLTYSQITKAVGLPKSSTHRILSILQDEGLISLDPVRHVYHPGPMLLGWATKALNVNDLPEISASTIVTLSAQTESSAGVSVLDGENILWLKMVDYAPRHRHSPRVGDRAPVHATAAGKVLLAHIDPARRDMILKSLKFESFTSRTITDPALMATELTRIQKAGFATSNREEFMQDVGMAAPIYDHKGDTVAAISMWDTTGRKEVTDLVRQKKKLLDAAAEISRQLGFKNNRSGLAALVPPGETPAEPG